MTRHDLAEPASAVRAMAAPPVISAVPATPAVPAGSPDPGETGAAETHGAETHGAGIQGAGTQGAGADPDGEIIDLLMWRDAQQLLSRHAEPDPDGKCAWCGWRWPCPPRRLGERAEVVARRPRRAVAAEIVAAGIRHDIPAWRSGIDLQADESGAASAEIPVSPAVTFQPHIRGVVRLPRQHRHDPPAPA